MPFLAIYQDQKTGPRRKCLALLVFFAAQHVEIAGILLELG
jgi:hypothetical protein